jgi:hypothetical protein
VISTLRSRPFSKQKTEQSTPTSARAWPSVSIATDHALFGFSRLHWFQPSQQGFDRTNHPTEQPIARTSLHCRTGRNTTAVLFVWPRNTVPEILLLPSCVETTTYFFLGLLLRSHTRTYTHSHTLAYTAARWTTQHFTQACRRRGEVASRRSTWKTRNSNALASRSSWNSSNVSQILFT